MAEYLWNVEEKTLTAGLGELAYRSNLLGTDRAVCNWGGGNTSMKTTITDFRGQEVEVMW